jgi:beta-lactam-binding protein with PASTA domain
MSSFEQESNMIEEIKIEHEKEVNNIENSPIEKKEKATFKSFIKSKVFFKNLAFAGVITLTMLLLVDIVLKLYTDHGNAYQVPNLVGVHISKVDSIVKANDMRVVITDSVYLYDMPKSIVVKQNPSSTEKVKMNRKIHIIVNASSAKVISMPDLKNISIHRLESQLAKHKLSLGIVEKRPHISKDVVIKQCFNGVEIKPGTPIEEKSKIDFIIGSGLGSSSVSVPHLVGLDIKSAKRVLSSVALNLGAIINKGDTITDDLIIRKQNPSYNMGGSLREGSLIDIWVEADTTSVQNESL